MTYEEYITLFVLNLSQDDLIEIYNDTYGLVGISPFIYKNKETFFIDNFSSIDEIIKAVSEGNYRYKDRYVMKDINGKIKSGNYLIDFADKDELIDILINSDYKRKEYEKLF